MKPSTPVRQSTWLLVVHMCNATQEKTTEKHEWHHSSNTSKHADNVMGIQKDSSLRFEEEASTAGTTTVTKANGKLRAKRRTTRTALGDARPVRKFGRNVISVAPKTWPSFTERWCRAWARGNSTRSTHNSCEPRKIGAHRNEVEKSSNMSKSCFSSRPRSGRHPSEPETRKHGHGQQTERKQRRVVCMKPGES